MDITMIRLWENNIPGYNDEFKGEIPSLTPYLIDNGGKTSAVIVFPGGGYSMKAPHEGEPIALVLNRMGISAFVLDYRVAPYKHPYPLMDAQRAVRYVRYMSKEWNIKSDKIGVLGFSAGGHLASTLGTHFDLGCKECADPIERVSCRPDAMVLCYPVITFGELSHQGSVNNLLGESPTPEQVEFLSNEKQVTKDTPPAFIWHTANDGAVPVENSLMFASTLSKHKIKFELHVFPDGCHGLGLAEDDPVISIWPDLCGKWLKGIGF